MQRSRIYRQDFTRPEIGEDTPCRLGLPKQLTGAKMDFYSRNGYLPKFQKAKYNAGPAIVGHTEIIQKRAYGKH
jgi:hypothetical protein